MSILESLYILLTHVSALPVFFLCYAAFHLLYLIGKIGRYRHGLDVKFVSRSLEKSLKRIGDPVLFADLFQKERLGFYLQDLDIFLFVRYCYAFIDISDRNVLLR